MMRVITSYFFKNYDVFTKLIVYFANNTNCILNGHLVVTYNLKKLDPHHCKIYREQQISGTNCRLLYCRTDPTNKPLTKQLTSKYL